MASDRRTGGRLEDHQINCAPPSGGRAGWTLAAELVCADVL
jgi:hypothetical protein